MSKAAAGFISAGCATIMVTPNSDQVLTVGSSLNVTFTCNVSGGEFDLAQTKIVWEVEARVVDNSTKVLFESTGIFVEERSAGVVDLTVTTAARMLRASGVRVRCAAFTTGAPVPTTVIGPTLLVRFLMKPSDPPRNLQILSLHPIVLTWNRPTDVSEETLVEYTLTINSTSSDSTSTDSLVIVNDTETSVVLSVPETEQCTVVVFSLVASVAGMDNSSATVVMVSFPIVNMESINESLRVDSVNFLPDGNLTAIVSFQNMGFCHSNFTIRNHTVFVSMSETASPIFEVITTVTPITSRVSVLLTSYDYPTLLPDAMFRVEVEVCTDQTCGRSISIPLNTTGVQFARAIFFENFAFIGCYFANGLNLRGCQVHIVMSQVVPGIPFPLMSGELFDISSEEPLPMSVGMCAVRGNQNIVEITVMEIDDDLLPRRPVVTAEIIRLSNASVFTDITGCRSHDVSLQFQPPMCPDGEVIVTCSSTSDEDQVFSWFYEGVEFGINSFPARRFSTEVQSITFSVTAPSRNTSQLIIQADAIRNEGLLKCSSNTTSGSNSTSEETAVMLTDFGPPRNLRQSVIASDNQGATLIIEWDPLTTRLYTVVISDSTGVRTMPSNVSQFNLTVSYNQPYTIRVSVDAECSLLPQSVLSITVVGCSAPLPPDFGRIFPFRSSIEGSFLSYQCNDGFMPREAAVSICGSNGRWQPDPSSHTCSTACESFITVAPANGVFAMFGTDTVMFGCEEGFIGIPSSSITFRCINVGQWLPNPEDVQCVRESTPTDEGNITDSNVTTIEDVLTPDLLAVASGISAGVFIGISIAVVMVALVGVVFLLLCCLYLYRKKKRDSQDILNDLRIDTGENNMFSVKSSKYAFPKHLTICSAQLTLGKTLGQGEFGVVYQAKLDKNNIVAVKTLRGFVDKVLVEDLLKECARMSEFNHPNVLTLSGVCLDGGPAPYIVMPFMENGSLLSYLRKDRDSVVLESSTAGDVEHTTMKLLDICLQVAKGMEYLAAKRVVHRDLAARNCMIDYNLVIKVADFGLSESIDTAKQYFRQDQQVVVRLPIKWLAIESITDGIFSEKTDVWSYGVTCWEVFTGGKTPYPGIHPVDLPSRLAKGHRLEKPLNVACSDKVFSIMKICWETHCKGRPTFSELVENLSSLLQAMAGYLNLSTQLLVTLPDSISTHSLSDKDGENHYIKAQ